MHRLFLAALLIFNVCQAHAKNVKTKEQILAAASQGRIGFLQTIGELEEIVGFTPDKKTVLNYLRIIPELELIATELNFDSLGGDPLYRLKNLVAKSLLKWVNVIDDEISDLALFIKYSNDHTMWQFLEGQSGALSRLKDDLEAMEKALEKFQTVAQLVSESDTNNSLKKAYSATLSEYLAIILEEKRLSLDELSSYLEQIYDETGYRIVGRYLWKYTTETSKASELKQILELVFYMYERFESAPFFVTSDLKDLPGGIAVITIDKMLVNKVAPSKGTVELVFEYMQRRQIEDTLYILTQIKYELLTKSQIEFIYELASKGVSYLGQYSLIRQADEIKKVVEKIALIRVLNSDIEGAYELKMGGGKYKLSLLKANSTQLHAVIAADGYSYAMVHSFYDVDKGEIVLSRHYDYDVSPVGSQNYTMRIKSFGYQKVTGVFDNGRNFYSFGAKKIKNFTEYLSRQPNSSKESVSGKFEGKIQAGGFSKAIVVINETGPVVNATVTLETKSGAFVSISYVNGTLLTTSNVLYLSSSETRRGTILHLRGYVENGQFVGSYIITGENKEFRLRLKKVSK